MRTVARSARRTAVGLAFALALSTTATTAAAEPSAAEPPSSDPAAQEEPRPGTDLSDPSSRTPEEFDPGALDAVEQQAVLDSLAAYLDAADHAPQAQRIAAGEVVRLDLADRALPADVSQALASSGAAGTVPQAIDVPQRAWPVGTAPAGAPGLVQQLPVVHRSQITNFYCGAAAGVQALLAIPGAERSRVDGQALSQQALASDRYFMTDRNGKTSWAQRRLTIGMNRWLTGSDAGPYRYVDAPSAPVFLGAVASSMTTGRPAFVDAEEDPTTGRYNNHPDNGRVFSHIMTVRGWDTGTGEVQFVDPWSMAYFDPSNGTRIRPMFWYDGNSFATKFLDDFGIVF